MNEIIDKITAALTAKFDRELSKGYHDDIFDRMYEAVNGMIGQKISIRVYVGVIEHQHGFNHYVSESKAGLWAQLRAFCEEYADEAGDPDAWELATTDEERVSAYFEDHQTDYLTWDVSSMEVTL